MDTLTLLKVKDETIGLDQEVSTLSQRYSDDVINMSIKAAGKGIDSHLAKDLEGVKSAFHGRYAEAVKILGSEHGQATRTKENNPIEALANTIYGVSLLKMGRYGDAEQVLKQEQRFYGTNCDSALQAINSKALRVALLSQGKSLEKSVEEVGLELKDVFQGIQSNLHEADIQKAIQQRNKELTAIETQMAEVKTMMKTSNDPALKSKYEGLMLEAQLTVILKMEIEGARLAKENKFAEALKYLEELPKLDRYRDNVAKVHANCSAIYGYCLLTQKKYAEAEQRFYAEVERDRSGKPGNTAEFRMLNQLGLEYALLRQGKFAEAAQENSRRQIKQAQVLPMPTPMKPKMLAY